MSQSCLRGKDWNHNTLRAVSKNVPSTSTLSFLHFSNFLHRLEVGGQLTVETGFQPLTSFFFLKVSLFLNNCRFTGSCKEITGRVHETLTFNVNVLHNHKAVSNPENWHWFNPQSLLRFHWLCINSCVCVCMCVFACLQLYAIYHVWFSVTPITIKYIPVQPLKAFSCYPFKHTPFFSYP